MDTSLPESEGDAVSRSDEDEFEIVILVEDDDWSPGLRDAAARHAHLVMAIQDFYFVHALPKMGYERGSADDRDLRASRPLLRLALRQYFSIPAFKPIRYLPRVPNLRQTAELVCWDAIGRCPTCGDPVEKYEHFGPYVRRTSTHVYCADCRSEMTTSERARYRQAIKDAKEILLEWQQDSANTAPTRWRD